MKRDFVFNVTKSKDGEIIDRFRFATDTKACIYIAHTIAHESDPDVRITFDCTFKNDFVRYVYDEGRLSEHVLGQNFLAGDKGFAVADPVSDIERKVEGYRKGTYWAEGPDKLDDYLSAPAGKYGKTLRIEHNEDLFRVDLSRNRLPLPPDLRMLYEYSGMNPANEGFSTIDMMHRLSPDMRPAGLKVEELKLLSMLPVQNAELFTFYEVSCVIDNTLVTCTYQYLKEYIDTYGRPTDAEFAAGLLDDYFADKVEIWQNRCAAKAPAKMRELTAVKEDTREREVTAVKKTESREETGYTIEPYFDADENDGYSY